MNSLPLPQELVGQILLWVIRMSPSNKNSVTPLRLVCSSFDQTLRAYLFKTLQLEFSKFASHAAPDVKKALERVGHNCHAIYLDMMVVRDEEEITRLSDVFQGITSKIPEMESLIQSLRRYCMNDTTFDELDFTRVTGQVLSFAPNLTRLRVNLPFQVVGRSSTTATLLLANILASVANRSEEFKPLDVLVVDHLSDTTVLNICHNPQDVKNAVTILAGLRSLVLSIKRQDARGWHQDAFAQHLWYLIRKAVQLKSLCIIGWNVKRSIEVRKHRHGVGYNDWTMRSMPYPAITNGGLQKLRSLELKRVDVYPESLVRLILENSKSLKEVYLNEVYLKIDESRQQHLTARWIGHHDSPRHENCCWVAEALRNSVDLQLETLRATGLGYDDFAQLRTSTYPNYDLTDPSGLDRSFDRRFVEAVMPPIEKPAVPEIVSEDQNIIQDSSQDSSAQNPPQGEIIEPSGDVPMSDAVTDASSSQTEEPVVDDDREDRLKSEYDVEAFQTFHQHNTTSHFKKSLDGYFNNHNERALLELQRIITVADRGMALISAEIDRSHAVISGAAPAQ